MDMLKKCKECQKEKPLDEFQKHKHYKDGCLNKCKECVSLNYKKKRNINIDEFIAKSDCSFSFSLE